jgi:hypothetical protein
MLAVITPDRRCHAPHLGASLSLALRVNRRGMASLCVTRSATVVPGATKTP